MDRLTLTPAVDVRDVRVQFAVGDRTIRSHMGSRREAPALVSLAALAASMQGSGESPILACSCSKPECDELPSVEVTHGPDRIGWAVELNGSVVRYRFDPAQMHAEFERTRTTVQRALDKSHHMGWRFHPTADETLFQIERPSRGRYLRNNLIFVSAVALVTVGLWTLVSAM